VFEAPITLSEPPGRDDSSAYWEWIALACEALRRDTPYGQQPEYLAFHHTEEYKERAEREAAEDECGPRTKELLRSVLENKRSSKPFKKDSTAYFFVRERFGFARSVALALATSANNASPQGAAPSPKAAPKETILWLALDVYDAGHFISQRWSQQSRYDY
jgi:hypothetical protein